MREDPQEASRFSNLLQPIRDLAENWNIDIARELEEYIEILSEATFSAEPGGPKLNFAEGLLAQRLGLHGSHRWCAFFAQPPS